MKDFKIYLGVASVLLVIYLCIQYNKPKPINWTETLSATDKIPYGTYIFYHQLHDIFPNAQIRSYGEPVYSLIKDHDTKNASYIIIAKDIDLKEFDYNKLIPFIQKGNDVFISANSFGSTIAKKLKIETGSQFVFGKKLRDLRFMNKALSQTTIYTADQNLTLSYFSSLDTAKAIALGEDGTHHINFIKYYFGKGTLYLHTNPLIFTNYSLLNNQGAEYTSVLLSHINNNKNLIWDDYYSGKRDDYQSPLHIFLNNTALRSAFYIALFSLLIFVLFEIKRRQRIIPIIEPLKNSTLDFVNVVGQVYYEQRNNSNISQKKAAYFLEHLRTQYNLKTAILDEEFVSTLAHKSDVEPSLIRELLNQVTLARSGAPVTDRELIDLNKNIEQFYLQAR